MAQQRIEEIGARFGLRWVAHRIGEHTVRAAEVRDVDRCVEALYPHCLVDHGDAPVWMISWPAAFALAEYLLRVAGPLTGQRVLELGCGTAVVGIAAALGGACVVCTDYDENALALASYNAKANGVHPAGQSTTEHPGGVVTGSVQVASLDWYQPALKDRFPWVVGSEIAYHETAFAPLLNVLEGSLAPGGRAVFSDIYRRQTTAFLDRCRAQGWLVETRPQLVHLPEASYEVRIAELARS